MAHFVTDIVTDWLAIWESFYGESCQLWLTHLSLFIWINWFLSAVAGFDLICLAICVLVVRMTDDARSIAVIAASFNRHPTEVTCAYYMHLLFTSREIYFIEMNYF